MLAFNNCTEPAKVINQCQQQAFPARHYFIYYHSQKDDREVQEQSIFKK